MARIVFVPWHFAGNMNASFALARSLAARGHEIHYASLIDLEPRIRAQGFGFQPIFTALYPKGRFEEENQQQASGAPFSPAQMKELNLGTFRALRDGELAPIVAAVKPDAFVIANSLPWVAIAAHREKVPVALFSSTLLSPYDPTVPPINSDLIPDGTLGAKLKIRWTWLRDRFFMRLGGLALADLNKGLTELARICEFPIEKIDFAAEGWPRLDLPEVVLCPRDFDFPREHVPPNAIYGEPGVDTQRKDVAFPWERLDPAKPLVYVAAGSIASHMHPMLAREFFQRILDAVTPHPEWQVVCAIGKYQEVASYRAPAHAVLVNEAPQLELLRKAKLLVTHAGMNSVKEAIYCGVPMVAIPLFFDQVGFAARIAYHGLGVRLDPMKATPDVLRAGMETVLGDPTYATKIAAMSKIFVDAQERSPCATAIEDLIRRSSRGAATRG